MSTRDKRFYHALFGIPAQQMINNSLNTLYLGAMSLWRKFMKSKTPSRYIRCCSWNRFQYRWRFLRFDSSLQCCPRWCRVTTTSYKILPIMYKFFLKKELFFWFYRHQSYHFVFGKLGNGTFSYWILVDFRDRHWLNLDVTVVKSRRPQFRYLGLLSHDDVGIIWD
jgi:hypothetical protein